MNKIFYLGIQSALLACCVLLVSACATIKPEGTVANTAGETPQKATRNAVSETEVNRAETGAVEPTLPLSGGVITSGVGVRTDPIDGKLRFHNGIDIALPEGSPIMPAAPGVVVYSGVRSGYGNALVVKHANGLETLYGHNSLLMVSEGQFVDKDTVIALSGNTGRSTGPHLHFEAWQSGINVTPAFMPGSAMSIPQIIAASYKAKASYRKEMLAMKHRRMLKQAQNQ